MAKEIVPQRLRFIEEYMIDFNATAATIRAGYSPGIASQIGHELLRKPEVADEIARRRADLSAKAGLAVETLVIELKKIALADRSTIFEDDGVTLKALTEWPDNVRACISGIDTVTTPGGKILYKVKLHDKVAAIDMLMKYTGGFEKDNEQKAQKKIIMIGYDKSKTQDRPAIEDEYIEYDEGGDSGEEGGDDCPRFEIEFQP